MRNGTEIRKAYRKPHLLDLGDLRSMTLGGSPGVGDSGTSRSRKPISPMPQPGGFPRLPGVPQPGEPADDGATGL